MADEPRPFTGDELAGIVEQFGALTVTELTRAISELSFRETGVAIDEERARQRIENAVEAYDLACVTNHEPSLLIAGPAAFPSLPPGAADLHHLLDVPGRSVNREPVAQSILERIAAELDDDPGERRTHELIGLTYDVESWGDIDAASLREPFEDG